jgi:two-component system response regulator NreC
MEMIIEKCVATFSPRALEILRLIARPYSRKQISTILDMNSKTLQTHISRIMDKTGTHGYVELIAFAQANGFGKIEEENGS